MTVLHSHEDIDDFLRGADIMAVGGSGDPKVASGLLHDDLDRELTVGWSPLDLTADGLYCTPPAIADLQPQSRSGRARKPTCSPPGAGWPGRSRPL